MSAAAPSSCVVLLAGPTAVGKSEVALHLAERLGGEIVSVDSMQVYRGLDIGTDKPSSKELARVRHHLIDVTDLAHSFDAAQFVHLARQAVVEIQARGRLPLLCGGTGLYFTAWLDGLGEAPASDPQLRTVLELAPLEDLLRELAERDPDTYARIDRRNPRRVIRALEVIRLTGKRYSSLRSPWQSTVILPPHTIGFTLAREADDLRERINRRVEQMFARGLVEETAALLARGLEHNRTAMQALGYRQAVEHLRGERPLEETIELVKRRTRQFAKRQLTWFRGHLPFQSICLGPDDGASATAERLISACATALGLRG